MVTTTIRPDMEEKVKNETASRIALIVEYDGTNYFGSQLQVDRPTIQAEMEKALRNLTGEPVRVSAASRTDSGVHARGQVFCFKTTADLPQEAFIHGLNHYLPDDIAVQTAYKTALHFDARRTAINREYTYSILNSDRRSPLAARFAYRIPLKLNVEVMNDICQKLVGIHDFASFASGIGSEPEKSTTRNVYRADVKRDGEMIIFTVVANAFLRHQVRNIAGTLVRVGLGKINMTEFTRILEARQPGLAGPTLPACGLCLVRVNYPCTIEEMKL